MGFGFRTKGLGAQWVQVMGSPLRIIHGHFELLPLQERRTVEEQKTSRKGDVMLVELQVLFLMLRPLEVSKFIPAQCPNQHD